jgi:hypothetical protein
VRQTRDVAFEAEDALDDFFYEVSLASQLASSSVNHPSFIHPKKKGLAGIILEDFLTCCKE